MKLADERVMGVVGYGEVGRECALLAKGLGMRIQAVRRKPERSTTDLVLDRVFAPHELQEMLAQIDVLVCAAPLTADTYHMIGATQFEVMKPTAIVINVGRGPVIDEAAMIRALQDKRIAGASLDVFEQEPLPENSPLWDMDNVLISPYCTDRTEDPDWLDLSIRAFIANFHRYRKGEPLENVVDKRAGYWRASHVAIGNCTAACPSPSPPSAMRVCRRQGRQPPWAIISSKGIGRFALPHRFLGREPVIEGMIADKKCFSAMQ